MYRTATAIFSLAKMLEAIVHFVTEITGEDIRHGRSQNHWNKIIKLGSHFYIDSLRKPLKFAIYSYVCVETCRRTDFKTHIAKMNKF